MDELEGLIAELLGKFPAYRILAAVSTAERAREVEERFGPAVKAVIPGAPLSTHVFNAFVTEVEATDDNWAWAMDVLPTRMAPGAILWRVGEAA